MLGFSFPHRLTRARLVLDVVIDQLLDTARDADLRYASASPDWQESEAGLRHCAESAELREAVERLRQFRLPSGEGLG